MALSPRLCPPSGASLAGLLVLGVASGAQSAAADTGGWQYGAYLDVSYADDLGGDRTIEWRSKLTTRRLNAFDPNMGMMYLYKPPDESSRWGLELGLQGGDDMDAQKPSKSQNPLPGADVLSVFSRANVSYLADIGNGLKLQAGLMNSFIGFESMYAGQNPNYTRSWMADYSPYFLIGAGAEYAVLGNLSAGLYLLSDYDYLAFVGDQPKYGAQLKWRPQAGWTLTQNLFFGPEQKETALSYWRGFSDTILEWRSDEILLAMAYDIGTQKLATSGLQTVWMGSAIWSRWHIDGPWSLALRPEIYWDPDGQLTGLEQFISAVTLTSEYRTTLVGTSAATVRMEFRHDTSIGPEGGFFNAAGNQPLLVPGQNLLFFALILTYDENQ
ncbi:hypothetical protein JCM19379_09040 [Methyloparacoccus murrellii]